MFFKQEKVTKFLESFFDNPEQPVQSLLFWGEEKVGKMTTAKLFSKSLLCLSSPQRWGGCGHCDSCLMMEKGLHPDFMIIEPDQGTLSIEQVRKGIEFLSYRPQLSSRRILIINQAERMTKDAQNAFLKTLEEPPRDCLIILITTSPQLLLPTVRSRLLALRFPRASSESIKVFLQQNFSLPEKMTQEIAQQARGKIGLALSLLDADYKAKEEKAKKDLRLLLKNDFNYQSDYFAQSVKEEDNFQFTVQFWLQLIEEDIVHHSSHLDLLPSQKIRLANNLLQALHLINTFNVNKQLLMENIFLPYASSSSH